MTDNEITEAYFKALGWVYLSILTADDRDGYFGWVNLEGEEVKLPNILESNSAFIREVLEVMHNESITMEANTNSKQLHWQKWGKNTEFWVEPIHDNDIPRAAVLAATRYWEGKK